MTHDEIQDSLAIYRGLRGPERAEVDQHVAGCSACRAILNAYMTMDQDLAGLRDPRPDSRVRQRLYAAIGDMGAMARPQPIQQARSSVRLVMFAAAAVLLLVVASAVAVWQGWLPERANTIGRPFATPIPTPHSSLIGSFVWQTDGAYGYQMLRPGGWEVNFNGDRSAWRSFVMPGRAGNADVLGVMVSNFDAKKDLAEADGMLQAWLPPFEQNPTLEGWTASIEEEARRSGGGLELVRSLPDARIYLWRLDASLAIPQVALVSFKVSAGSPVVIYLAANGAYANLDRLEAEGVVDDLATMVQSARAFPADPRNVVPALSALPTPTAVHPATTPIATSAPQPAATSPRATDPALPAGCAATGMDTSLLASEDGYCLLYPARMQPSFSNAPDREVAQRLALVKGADPLVLSIITAPANGYSLDEVARNVVSPFPTETVAQVKRSDARLGGEPAVILDNMPGQPASRQAFVIHGDRLYRLVLQPYGDPAFAQLQAEAQTLWDTVASSWTFIPVVSATPAPPSPVTPQCDVVCQDATAAVGLTLIPVPQSTYSPSFGPPRTRTTSGCRPLRLARRRSRQRPRLRPRLLLRPGQRRQDASSSRLKPEPARTFSA